ncbi:Translation initiation factor eIF-2B subunit gamma [Pleurostoma richardsiae]|uniref:Translation initiation factor eIF2B subunit gamma n=1 Tax=Pleurostoma richardsiae TaxID=41990 RepID=A0AA38VFS9_9PEZI|nr:Translation initiation factor eIF-2B subunit gamma [Pleurostoma richardsiae]
MPHAVSMATPGLQALILCGPGSSFTTFMSNPDENPKALLPIANRPMVWYPLDFCYRTGITDITLICPPSAEAAMSSALKINPFLTSLPFPKPVLLAPKGLEQTTGTAEILRLPEVRAAVTEDFVVLPCDLVCEVGGELLLQAWMVKSASLSDMLGDADAGASRHSGGLGVWYPTKAETPIKGEETDFIATTPLQHSEVPPPKGSLLPHLSNLVTSMPTDALNDLVEEKNGFAIRHGLLRRHPRVRMLTTHRDAHIYIFPRWVMDFVNGNERLETISEDVIGWWAKAAWQPGLSDKLGMKKALEGSGGDVDASSKGDDGDSPEDVDPEEYRPEPSPSRGQSPEVTRHVPHGDRISAAASQGLVPPLLAYVHPAKPNGPLIRRVDNAPLLLAISLQLAKLPSVEEAGADAASPFAHARKVAYPEGVKSRTTISRQDSLVAENVTVEEKTAIKESVVGANCQIREGAKLSQCLLMEGVVVGKGCKLTRCILGRRSEIGDGTVLTDCEVQENLLVEPRTEDKNNKLMSSSGLEATEEEMEDVLQEAEADDGAPAGDDEIAFSG